MKNQTISEILARTDIGTTVTANGWVRTRRDSKGFSFIELNDGSCFGNLQVIADESLLNYGEIAKLQPGSAIRVDGKLVKSPGKEQAIEVHAEDVTIYGTTDVGDYPLQKKRISLERLREIAHLRPRTNTFGALIRVRNALAQATHDFFQQNRFYYLHTPIITASDCEGAGEMFRVTTLDLENPPRKDDGRIDWSQDFFGREANLTVSGQLSGETYACALGRIYTFGPTFRAENSNTSRHLSEFWMIEPEMAFADLDDNADLAESYLKFMITRVLDTCADDMAFFNKWIEKGIIDQLQQIVDSEFARMTYTEAIEILGKSGKKFDYPVSWGADLQSEHERYLTEEHLKRPLILTDYPKEIKAFYMRLNDDGKTVRAMDVLVPRIGEIIGGSQREERLDVLERRIVETGMDPADYWWYLDLRRFGTVPHAGFGLGFERMVQYCTGLANIRDVIPYPRTPRHAEF